MNAPAGPRGRAIPGGREGERGAVYVEFVIAFMPFFTFFLCLWQVAILYSSKLVVDHAANAAARAAAVIYGEDPANFGGEPANVANDTGQRATLVRTAAELAAAPLIVDHTLVTLKVSYPNFPNGGTIQPMNPYITTHMVARVTADMNCKIMLANALVCKPSGIPGVRFSLPIVSDGDFPYMGAPYNYNP